MKNLAALTATFILIVCAGTVYGWDKGEPLPRPESDYSEVEGYVEDVVRGDIVLYGRYYYIGGASLLDLSGNSVDRGIIKRGAKVRMKLRRDAVTEVIYIHGPMGEGFGQ